MATRFRLTSSATAPAVSPAFQAYTHNQSVRRKLLLTDTSTLTTQDYFPDAADDLDPGDALHVQFVSNPLASGAVFTSGDTLKWCVQGTEVNGNNNQKVQVFVGVVSEDGATARATLRTKVADDTEFAGSLTSRFHSVTLDGTYTLVAGDRIVVEFSSEGDPASGGGVQGHNASLRWGSGGAGGDLLENDTQTGTTLDPWIEFVTNVTEDAGGITGTAAPTQADDTSTASGAVTFTGTAAPMQADQTSTATGTVTNPVTGTVAVTQESDVSTASGAVTITGTVAVTQEDQTSTASGSVADGISGTVAVTQEDDTSTASGAITYTGTATPTQADQTSTASGSVANPVTGTVAATQANQTASAVGTVEVTIFLFTPPTTDERQLGFRKPFWFYDIGTPRSVLIEAGVVSDSFGLDMDRIEAADVGSGYANRSVFLGGRTWTVTEAEKALLEAAGYLVEAA